MKQNYCTLKNSVKQTETLVQIDFDAPNVNKLK